MIIKANVTTTATLVSAAKNRQILVLQNLSDTDIFFAAEGSTTPTTDAGATPGLRLAPGAMFAAENGNNHWAFLTNGIYAIHGGTGSKVLTIHEA